MEPASPRGYRWRWWPGAVLAGIGASIAGSVAATRLGHGGLAPVAVVALVGVTLGAPLAAIEWDSPGVSSLGGRRWPWLAPAVAAGTRLWLILVVAAAIAPSLQGWPMQLAAVAVWLALPRVVVRFGDRIAVGFAILAAAVLGLTAAISTVAASPWTLLDPRWDNLAVWGPGAVLAGFWLPALGAWGERPALPGGRRAPWLSLGSGLAMLLLAALALGARFEAQLPVELPLFTALAFAAGVSALAAPIPNKADPLPTPWVGAAATLWFATAGAPSLGAWWSSLCGVGPFAVAVALAFANQGFPRVIAAASALLIGGCVVAGWPGLPGGVSGAAGVALLAVAATWLVGTSALRAPVGVR